MADEDMDMMSGDNDSHRETVTNHTDTDSKASSHWNDRTAGGQEMDTMSDQATDSCVQDPGETAGKTEGVDTSGGAVPDAEGGSTEDEKTRSTSEGGSVEGNVDTDGMRNPPEGEEANEGTASEKTSKSGGGEADDGMTTEEDVNHTTKRACDYACKLLDSLGENERKSRRSRRSYRQRNTESGAGDGSQSESDSDEEERRRDADSSPRSGRTHSDTSETESDMEQEPQLEEEGDAASKTSTTELSSDLEDELLAKLLPKPTWRALPSLRSRELGFPREQATFCSRAIGSVHMVSRFEKYCELKHHEGCVNTLHFNQSGRLLASGSDDLNIVLWDWGRQKTTLVYPSGHRSNVFQAKFMPFSGDTTLVSCARDGQVRVGELSSTGICKGTKKLVQHKGAAHKLGLEPDSPVVFMSCGEDAAVFNIDLRTSKATKLVTVKDEVRKVALYTIFINPMNTDEFCVGGRDHFVRVYDRRKVSDEHEGLVKKFCPHHLLSSETRANVTCCVYSYNGREILASYNDEDIYLFDSTQSDGADFIRSYKGHRNNQTVKGVNFYGPQSEFVVSGSDCGNIFLWEKNTERIVQYMKGDHQGVVNCLESHPSSAVLATSGLDHDVKIWMPTAPEPSHLEGLKRTMYSNRREREEEKSREPDMIDGHMLMFLMQHLRRRARRQAREAGEMDSDSASSDSDTSDDEDAEGGLPNDRPQCAPS